MNKGNSEFCNRSDQIKLIIKQHNPDIIIINELNIKQHDTMSKLQFQNYKMITDGLDITDQYSRTGMLISNDIHYKRRNDLEAQGLSTIWIQLTYPRRRPILVQGIYRQFRRLVIKDSHTLKAQKQRWSRILDKWQIATNEGLEILTMGDCNLNRLTWDIKTEQLDIYDRSRESMVTELKDKILNNGHTTLNNSNTRSKDNINSKESCLDVMFTNRLDKINSFQSGIPGFSDHTIQIMSRNVKNIQKTQKIIKIRSYKNFSNQIYKDNIKNHPMFIETYYEKDPQKITQNLQQIILNSIDELAPMKNVQLSLKKPIKNKY